MPKRSANFQIALKLYPQYDTALADYVSLMFSTNNPAKAMALASQYAAANPNRAAAHFIYGSALASTKKLDQALQEYQKVIQLDPKSVMAYIHIGQIYELTNRPDDALAIYQKALQIQPNSPLVNNFLGNLYVHKGDLKSAGKYFQAALSQNAHDPVAANNLAWVYACGGREPRHGLESGDPGQTNRSQLGRHQRHSRLDPVQERQLSGLHLVGRRCRKEAA